MYVSQRVSKSKSKQWLPNKVLRFWNHRLMRHAIDVSPVYLRRARNLSAGALKRWGEAGIPTCLRQARTQQASVSLGMLRDFYNAEPIPRRTAREHLLIDIAIFWGSSREHAIAFANGDLVVIRLPEYSMPGALLFGALQFYDLEPNT